MHGNIKCCRKASQKNSWRDLLLGPKTSKSPIHLKKVAGLDLLSVKGRYKTVNDKLMKKWNI